MTATTTFQKTQSVGKSTANIPLTVKDRREGRTAVINGKRYRWPSKYQWKQARKLYSEVDYSIIYSHITSWFANDLPVMITKRGKDSEAIPEDVNHYEVDEDEGINLGVQRAFNFLKRANSH